jgi:hypothetical protein
MLWGKFINSRYQTLDGAEENSLVRSNLIVFMVKTNTEGEHKIGASMTACFYLSLNSERTENN